MGLLTHLLIKFI